MKLWKEDLEKVNKKAADSLADPSEYENLFPEFQEAVMAEQFLKHERVNSKPASEYKEVQVRCQSYFSKAGIAWGESDSVGPGPALKIRLRTTGIERKHLNPEIKTK